jgi:hypothetical protein
VEGGELRAADVLEVVEVAMIMVSLPRITTFPIVLPVVAWVLFGVYAVFVCFLYRDRRPRPRSMRLSGALYS